MKETKNAFLSGLYMGLSICMIIGILLLIFRCSDNPKPIHVGTTKSKMVVTINPNTMRVIAVPKGEVYGTIVKIDSIAYDGIDSSGNLSKSFVTAFTGKKPVASIFKNLAWYEK